MQRTEWVDLSAEAREAVESHTGQITEAVPALNGNHADIACTLETAIGRVFVKAARKPVDQDGPEVRTLRWEAAINPYVSDLAPRLHWVVETGEWVVLGFEHVQVERDTDYSPGSPDLEILAKLIDTLQMTPCPRVLANKRVETRWASVVDDPSPMAGESLVMFDLNPTNLLLTADRAYLVDWGFAGKGAGWVELGQLVPWLIRAGHSPREADAWLSRFPSWADANPAYIGLHAQALATKWAANSKTLDEPWAAEMADLTAQWSAYRSTTSQVNRDRIARQ